MPNYGLQINSRFQPFTMQELLQPVMMATQAHQELADAYTELDTKASIWKNLANQQTDPIAYGKYKAFSDDLREQANILASEGLTPAVRNSLNTLRGRYSSEIVPIEQAYQRRAEQIAEQRKLGNSSINSYDAATTSLDTYLSNPSLSYERIDREDLYKRAFNEFGQIAKELRKYYKGDAVDKFTNTFVEEYGISKEQAKSFIEDVQNGNLSSSNPVLTAIYNNLYNSTQVDNWTGPQANFAKQRVMNTILEGVVGAIGKGDVHTYANQEEILRERAKGNKGKIPTINPLPARSLYKVMQNDFIKSHPKVFNVNTSGEVSVNQDEVKTILSKYDVFSQKEINEIMNGTATSDSGLLDKLKAIYSPYTFESTGGPGTLTNPDAQYIQNAKDDINNAVNIIKYLNITGKYRNSSSTSVKDMNKDYYTIDFDKINKELNDNPANATTLLYRQPEYFYLATDTDKGYISNYLGSISPKEGFNIVDLKYKDGNIKYTPSGKKLQKGDLNNYVIEDVSFGEAGYVVHLNTKVGSGKKSESVTIEIPKSKLTNDLDLVFNTMANYKGIYDTISEDDPYAEYKRWYLNQQYQIQEDALRTLFSNTYRPNSAEAYKPQGSAFAEYSFDENY